MGGRGVSFQRTLGSRKLILASFARTFYDRALFMPRCVLLPAAGRRSGTATGAFYSFLFAARKRQWWRHSYFACLAGDGLSGRTHRGG